MSIPADLLLKIFDQLPFKERVHLRGVNRLFRAVSEKSISTMRSLEINDDLIKYISTTQLFPSLLESCSPFLESIKVSDRSFSKATLNRLAEFIYPKLENLEIAVTNDELTKNLISRNRNVCSVVLHLNRAFAWPEDVVLEKLENLEIRSSGEFSENSDVNLSLTLRSLIGNGPNLKRFTIVCDLSDPPFVLSSAFIQLLASVPYLEVLNGSPFDFYHEAFMALPQLKYLQELRLPNLIVSKEKLMKMAKAFPSITVLETRFFYDPDIEILSELKHLRELYMRDNDMAKSELIDLINNIPPSLAVLKIVKISDVRSSGALIDFLKSTAALFQRNLEIRLMDMQLHEYDMELKQMQAILEEMKNNGWPLVEMDGWWIRSIRYNP